MLAWIQRHFDRVVIADCFGDDQCTNACHPDFVLRAEQRGAQTVTAAHESCRICPRRHFWEPAEAPMGKVWKRLHSLIQSTFTVAFSPLQQVICAENEDVRHSSQKKIYKHRPGRRSNEESPRKEESKNL
jgi:hypothetical protein